MKYNRDITIVTEKNKHFTALNKVKIIKFGENYFSIDHHSDILCLNVEYYNNFYF